MIDHKVLEVLQEGDIIFTSVPNLLYQSVERATNSCTSHVGILFKVDGHWVVAESRVPLSCYSPLDEFIGRSKNGWFSVRRVAHSLSCADVAALKRACDEMQGKLYHPGFNYRSNRQFCSKFVYDAYTKALGIEIGKLVTFKDLLDANRSAPKTFWRLWFFGFIPWNRLTVTPASQFEDTSLVAVIN